MLPALMLCGELGAGSVVGSLGAGFAAGRLGAGFLVGSPGDGSRGAGTCWLRLPPPPPPPKQEEDGGGEEEGTDTHADADADARAGGQAIGCRLAARVRRRGLGWRASCLGAGVSILPPLGGAVWEDGLVGGRGWSSGRG